MSKKLEVLQMLREAGDRGVRSDEFYAAFNGRGVARIYDLRHEGYVIEDEREGKYKRYRLTNVGSNTEGRDQAPLTAQPVDATLGVASGVADEPSFPSEDHSAAPAASSQYDPFEEWAA